MPRLDNTNHQIAEYFGLEFNEDDPGATEPVDICLGCITGIELALHLDTIELECDHPDYESEKYVCLECGSPLGSLDN